MKAKDLRLGNYVTEEGRLIHLHDGFGIDHAHNFEPIPLTEDWLVKFGFNVLRGEFTKWDDDSTVGIVIYFSTKSKPDVNIETSEHTHELRHIKHVHQLQNLYHALTGEELTIKQ